MWYSDHFHGRLLRGCRQFWIRVICWRGITCWNRCCGFRGCRINETNPYTPMDASVRQLIVVNTSAAAMQGKFGPCIAIKLADPHSKARNTLIARFHHNILTVHTVGTEVASPCISRERWFHDITDTNTSCSSRSGDWFNIKLPSYLYRKSHCGDKTILQPIYLCNDMKRHHCIGSERINN